MADISVQKFYLSDQRHILRVSYESTVKIIVKNRSSVEFLLYLYR
jgi:hypothetical protein